jgi:MoaA/NifB/PqqE/SkfB family radical SAM enzyme
MQQFFWHIELSSNCFLKCPRCIRADKLLHDKWVKTELTLPFIKKIFTSEYIKDNVKRILFCGNNGDPIYCKDFLKILKYFKEVKPDITLSIVTNGSYKSEEWWFELSQVLNIYDIITFSIDGWDNDSNNLYRINSDYDSIIKGINIIANNSSVHIAWSTILFKFNQDKIKQIEEVAKTNNVHYFQISFSNLFKDKDDPLKPNKEFISNTSYYQKTVKQINNNKYRTERIKRLSDEYKKFILEDELKPCKQGEKGLYINSQGILFPCSWIAHPFKKRNNLLWEDSFFIKHKEDLNLNKFSIDKIIKSKTWKTIENTYFFICKEKCLKEYR